MLLKRSHASIFLRTSMKRIGSPGAVSASGIYFLTLAVVLLTISHTSAQVTVDSNGCNITFREITDAHADGATLNSNYTTQQSCLDYCALLSSCVAVDVDNTNLPSIGCWVYTNASYILPDNSLYGGGGVVNEYQITRNCAPTTVTGKTTLPPGFQTSPVYTTPTAGTGTTISSSTHSVTVAASNQTTILQVSTTSSRAATPRKNSASALSINHRTGCVAMLFFLITSLIREHGS